MKPYIHTLYDHLGSSKVSVLEEHLEFYSMDQTETDPCRPDVVVFAYTKEDVEFVVQVAKQHKVPITPVVQNTNLGGLSIPEKGGIVLSMIYMNRILELDREDMYMVIEPGVSWQQIKDYLLKEAPELKFGYSLSPPETSVLTNCLLDGLVNLSLKYGSTANWINGIEAILPNGETIVTGSRAVVDTWCMACPMPDLTGLFVSWQGTTGIVTKLSVKLWPNKPFREKQFLLTDDITHGFELVRTLSRSDFFDEIGGVSWPLGKMMFGELFPIEYVSKEPKVFLFFDYSGMDQEELTLKRKYLQHQINKYRSQGVPFDDPFPADLITNIDERFLKMADMPSRLDFLIDHPFKGLTWVGTYGPTSNWAIAIQKGMSLMQKHGFPPSVVTRPMDHGHYGVLRFIEVFKYEDEDSRKAVRSLNHELVDLCLEYGFIPYKTPPWVVDKIRDRINPGFKSLMQSIKKGIDPDGIMNPGKWKL